MISSIFSAIAGGFAIALRVLGLSNTPAQQRSAAAKVDDKVDQDNTLKVQQAIKTGDVSELEK